ncbi:hypothetical protein [Pseudomonas denitrificans (nom. rej.)]|uniref:CCHC-type domain-containing protein n=1 Tax=Pseudomonas denitrificans TaxID=43306 RepID=A0A9X7R2K4_PSEDE|nr:hypothetical protein [Pseudomonas denitrificans (nom. rej.)]QEY70461.1 hypothetical protein F1C79_01625 [Pseudomonas denitrificans (nom. rej.)]
MTEQQACTLCGADGHRAFECPMRLKPAGYVTPAQLQVLQGFGGAGQVQMKVRTRPDVTHTVALTAIPTDQVLVPRRLLEDIEMTWRLWDRHAKPFNELGERKIREGLEELRSLLKHAAKA